MLLNARPIAVSIAVISFFALAIICWTSGLSPFTCCKRALTGAFFAFLMTVLAVKAINAILLNAIIKNQINKQKGNAGGDTD